MHGSRRHVRAGRKRHACTHAFLTSANWPFAVHTHFWRAARPSLRMFAACRVAADGRVLHTDRMLPRPRQRDFQGHSAASNHYIRKRVYDSEWEPILPRRSHRVPGRIESTRKTHALRSPIRAAVSYASNGHILSVGQFQARRRREGDRCVSVRSRWRNSWQRSVPRRDRQRISQRSQINATEVRTSRAPHVAVDRQCENTQAAQLALISKLCTSVRCLHTPRSWTVDAPKP